MSTKAIREVLAWARNNAPERLAERVEDARAELEAIEKAAKVLDEWSDEHPTERTVAMQRAAGDAFGLMAIIAKQEP